MKARSSLMLPSIKTRSSKDCANVLSLLTLTDGNASSDCTDWAGGREWRQGAGLATGSKIRHQRAKLSSGTRSDGGARRDLEYVNSVASSVADEPRG